MYLLVVRKREGVFDKRTKKITWSEWREWNREIHSTYDDLMDTLKTYRHYAGDKYEQFDVKYYPVDEKTGVTVKIAVVIEEVK